MRSNNIATSVVIEPEPQGRLQYVMSCEGIPPGIYTHVTKDKTISYRFKISRNAGKNACTRWKSTWSMILDKSSVTAQGMDCE